MQIDTVFVKDTVYVTLNKITPTHPETIDIYSEMISSQATTYNFLIGSFLGIVALFAGATWLYNKKIAHQDIINETKKLFEQERTEIINEFKSEFNIELHRIKGDNARSLALTIQGNKPHELVNGLIWWASSGKHYALGDKGSAMRICIDKSIELLKLISEEKDACRVVYKNRYSENNRFIKEFDNFVNEIPEVLANERKKIKELFEDSFGDLRPAIE